MDPDRAFTRGVVDEWFYEEGWGRLSSPELDGKVFAHFAMISDQEGFRALQAGQTVSFTWEDGEQDGCRFRATDIRSDPSTVRKATATQERQPGDRARAYESSLTIDWE